MKNLLKAFGIIALVAVIGFSMAGCDGGDDGNGGLSGKYVSDKSSSDYLEFTGSTAVLMTETGKKFEGTYSVSGNTVTITLTFVHDDLKQESGKDIGDTFEFRINQDNSLSSVWEGEVDESEKWIKEQNNNNGNLSGKYYSDSEFAEGDYLEFTGSTATCMTESGKMFEGTYSVSDNTVTITLTFVRDDLKQESGKDIGDTFEYRVNQDDSLSSVWEGEVDESEKWIKE